MKFHIYHHHEVDSGLLRKVNRKLDQILSQLSHITHQEVIMSKELDALEAQVRKNTEVNQSAVILIQGISQQLQAAGTDENKLKELQASLASSAQSLAEAIAANTPAAQDEGDEEDEDEEKPADGGGTPA